MFAIFVFVLKSLKIFEAMIFLNFYSFERLFFYLCVHLCVYAYMSVGAIRGCKRGPNLQKLELRVVVSHFVGDGI